MILKDNDLRVESKLFGSSEVVDEWKKMLKIDADYLKKENVMDYSLLCEFLLTLSSYASCSSLLVCVHTGTTKVNPPNSLVRIHHMILFLSTLAALSYIQV
jgi:hypothetical protein